MACLTYLKQLMAYCSDGELFLKDDSVVGDSLLLQIEMINTDCFYGRCLGFQVDLLPGSEFTDKVCPCTTQLSMKSDLLINMIQTFYINFMLFFVEQEKS